MADIDTLKEVQRMQVEFEKQIQKQFGEAVSAMMNTVNAGPVTLPTGGVDYGVENETSKIAELTNKIAVLEDAQQEVGFQLPISFRYRNDEASGTHRLEYIIKGTPYSNGSITTGTTYWPDYEWIAIPGADAKVYIP